MKLASSFAVVMVTFVSVVVSQPGPQNPPQRQPLLPPPPPPPPPPPAQPEPPAQSRQQPSGGSVDGLSAGYETVIGELKLGFSCDQKLYGYYADPLNLCKVFHVCLPIKQAGLATVYKQWTFFCSNQTLFNQEKFVCDRPENVDCSKAESLYQTNAAFSQPPDI